VRLEIGATYERRPIPTYPKPRRGVLVRVGAGLVELRDARGLLFTEATTDLVGPVEPDPPPRICPVCNGSREINRTVATDEAWLRLIDGTEPCPACSLSDDAP
jgi:hypothetical protein